MADMNDAIRELDDARRQVERFEAIDKLGRALILGSLGLMTLSFALALVLENGEITMMIFPACFSLGAGLFFWCHVNLRMIEIDESPGYGGSKPKTDRLSHARKQVRVAEAAMRAVMGGEE